MGVFFLGYVLGDLIVGEVLVLPNILSTKAPPESSAKRLAAVPLLLGGLQDDKCLHGAGWMPALQLLARIVSLCILHKGW